MRGWRRAGAASPGGGDGARISKHRSGASLCAGSSFAQATPISPRRKRWPCDFTLTSPNAAPGMIRARRDEKVRKQTTVRDRLSALNPRLSPPARAQVIPDHRRPAKNGGEEQSDALHPRSPSAVPSPCSALNHPRRRRAAQRNAMHAPRPLNIASHQPTDPRPTAESQLPAAHRPAVLSRLMPPPLPTVPKALKPVRVGKQRPRRTDGRAGGHGGQRTTQQGHHKRTTPPPLFPWSVRARLDSTVQTLWPRSPRPRFSGVLVSSRRWQQQRRRQQQQRTRHHRNFPCPPPR